MRVYCYKMALSIAVFTAYYDFGKIDGFPESSIEILEMVYGKSLANMRPVSIFEKVEDMQRYLTDVPDESGIREAVNYYLG